MPNSEKTQFRILIADGETLLARTTSEFLESKGFECSTVRDGAAALEMVSAWKPDLVLYDLMLPEINAVTFLKSLKQAQLLGEDGVKVFVVSAHHNSASNVKECLRNGACEYLVKPMKPANLLHRVVFHLQAKRKVSAYSAQSSEDLTSAQYYLHLTDLLLQEALKPAEPDECLHHLTGLLGMVMKAVRVSLVQCQADVAKGWVIASSDKRSIGGLSIDLWKYPEIVYVLRNEKLLALDNLAADPTMHFVTRTEKEIHFNSMIVCPVRIDGQIWGVMSARMPDSKESLTDFEIRFGQLAAHVMGLVVRSHSKLRHASLPSDGGLEGDDAEGTAESSDQRRQGKAS